MNRRDALRDLSLALGCALSPGVARALRAGFTAPPPGLPFRTLGPRQAGLVATMTEMIIPATDTPGARAARVDAFIDGVLTEIFTSEERMRFLAGLDDVDRRAREAAGRWFLEIPPAQQVAVLEAMERDARETPDDGPRPFFPWLKELTLVGYYTSEIGASQELRYVHVAGRYEGDVPYQRIGRAYS